LIFKIENAGVTISQQKSYFPPIEMHSNIVLFSLTLMILVSIFLPTQVFAKYYTGKCAEATLYGDLTGIGPYTEDEVTLKISLQEAIIDTVPRNTEEWVGAKQALLFMKECQRYFEYKPSSLQLFNGCNEPKDTDACPVIGCSKSTAIQVRDFQISQLNENRNKAGYVSYNFDQDLDRIDRDIKVLNECIAYFDQREQDIETLEELVPEDIRKPFEESIDPEDLKEIYDKECIIATASFGSPMAKEVQMLREIRDNQLLQTQSGSVFMSGFNTVYYSFAPTIANWENENLIFKEIVKTTITPLITSLSLLNHVSMDSEAEVLGYGISLILLNFGMYVGIPLAVVFGIRKQTR